MNYKKSSQFTRDFAPPSKDHVNTKLVSSSHGDLLNLNSGKKSEVKYFANLLDFGKDQGNDSVVHSVLSHRSRSSLVSHKSSFTLQTLPSLIIDVPRGSDIVNGKGLSAAKNFADTIPIVNRNRLDIFGVGGRSCSCVSSFFHLFSFYFRLAV